MFQKGPGEGYHEAKAEVLAIEPGLRCFDASHMAGTSYFVVLRGGGIGVGKRVGEGGPLARAAWASALVNLRSSSIGEDNE